MRFICTPHARRFGRDSFKPPRPGRWRRIDARETRKETGRNRPGLRGSVRGQETASSGSVGAREAMMGRMWNTLAITERMAKLDEAGW
jgi:hypothetical protein